ncbi:MAG: nucleotidyltransferase domain-containing protein [Oligoflexia bacterium]|nr:nucleotidyltransferase domain-containing protein [Oligoflexia bacterium]
MSNDKKDKDDIFVKIESVDALKGLSLNDYIANLSSYLQGKAEKAYIFGSYAKGNYTVDSDLDLIIVCKTNLPFFERFTLFPKIFEWTNELDILIYTPEEFEKIKNEKHVGFWKENFKTMKKIFDSRL